MARKSRVGINRKLAYELSKDAPYLPDRMPLEYSSSSSDELYGSGKKRKPKQNKTKIAGYSGGAKCKRGGAMSNKIGLKKGITIGLDALPVVAGFTTSAATANPLIGLATTAATKVGREYIRKKTGYGLKSTLKSIAKKGATIGLDAIPPIAGLAATSVTGNPFAGLAANVATKIGREFIREKTGYGKMNKVGKFLKNNAGNILDVAVPFATSGLYNYMEQRPESAITGQILGHAVRKGINTLTGVGKYKPKKKSSKANDLRVVRGQIMRQLMKEGFTFKEASPLVTSVKNIMQERDVDIKQALTILKMG